MNINHVTNGAYYWEPDQACAISWLRESKVVQVIRGKVRVFGVNAEMSVFDADKHGTFVRRLS